MEHLRDRLEDTEKWMERFATLTVEIAMLKVAQGTHVSKGHLADELGRTIEQVRKERERAMSELRTEMRAAFGEAIEDSFKRHAERQAKEIRLYTRIGIGLVAVLLIRDLPTAITFIRPLVGIP